MSLKIGVVGATGMVGETFMHVLSRPGIFKDPILEVRPFASDRSLGTTVRCIGRDWAVQVLKKDCFAGLDLVFFSSGDEISEEWGPEAVRAGAIAIDNSAAFRMSPEHALVVPEVNAHRLPRRDRPALIANPNCSTIQLVVALNALKKFGLKEVRVASYQSVSGAGKPARDELIEQLRGFLKELEKTADNQAGGINPVTIYDELLNHRPENVKNFPHPIAFNCIPQIGSFNQTGFCSEETKIMRETKKILELPDLKVSAFTVRVPGLNSHSEAVWVTFDRGVAREEIVECLRQSDGIEFVEQTSPSDYPTARMCSGKDPVFVGRLHRDTDFENTWLFWIVADNILKGAALNGLQIAQKIFG